MKRIALLLVFAFVAVMLPTSVAAEELPAAQNWCFTPNIFYSLGQCMTVYTDGYNFLGVDQKFGVLTDVMTLLQGRRLNRQAIELTVWQLYEETYFADFGYYELRQLKIYLHQTDDNRYEGKVIGLGFVFDFFEMYTQQYNYDIALSINEEDGEQRTSSTDLVSSLLAPIRENETPDEFSLAGTWCYGPAGYDLYCWEFEQTEDCVRYYYSQGLYAGMISLLIEMNLTENKRVNLHVDYTAFQDMIYQGYIFFIRFDGLLWLQSPDLFAGWAGGEWYYYQYDQYHSTENGGPLTLPIIFHRQGE